MENHGENPLSESLSVDPSALVPAETRRGRGAASNRSGRFERERRETADDGWSQSHGMEEAPVAFRPTAKTEVMIDASRSVIARNASPDIPFDRSINPYRGCEHGCVYCFARPTHAYLGLSPGLDFETKILLKPNAPSALAKELARKSYECRPIAIGTNTDPYQPLEKTYRVMRGVLEALAAHNHPVTIVTKGALITRDLDILGPMGRRGLARVALSVTSLDHRLSRSMEPRASSPARRLEAIKALSRAGVPTGVMLAPIIPAINDHEIERIAEAVAAAGAVSLSHITLRLPLEVKELFREWLYETRPDRAKRVMGLVREMHGGKDYDPEWGARLRGNGVYADLIATRVEAARKRHGLTAEHGGLRTDLFQVPSRTGDQLELF